jgi:OPA family glycerol-3-phosphate transporter-like MFS transporter 3
MVSIICSCFIFYSLTFTFRELSYLDLTIVFFFFGAFLQGVNNTISSVCSADVGRSSGRSKNVTSTVTGIIDGTGSIGAAIAMYLIGALKDNPKYGWKWGFMFTVAVVCTLGIIPTMVVLCKEVKEIKEMRELKRTKRDQPSQENLQDLLNKQILS